MKKFKIIISSFITAACLVLAAGCAAAPVSEKNGEGAGSETASLGDEAKEASGQGLKDGLYYVNLKLEGGTGKAGVESPAELTVEQGQFKVRLKWSSPYYDYMYIVLEGAGSSGEEPEKYTPVNTEGNSEFILPVAALDTPIRVVADTTAMSQPHEIEYTITLDASSITDRDGNKVDITQSSSDAADSSNSNKNADDAADNEGDIISNSLIADAELKSSMRYARYFDVENVSDGVTLITIAGKDRYLLAEEGAELPTELSGDAVVLQKPFKNIYLAASAPMDFFDKLEDTDIVKMTSTTAENWNLESIRSKVESGAISYVGKYSTPDFETVLSRGCDLCVESTMIYHKPETKEKLESLGIPVMVDYSSYENEPLGRLEWIKLYGLIMDREAETSAFFEEAERKLNAAIDGAGYNKSVAYFYVTQNGRVSVKKSNDYIVRMIEMAGGSYIFEDLKGDEMSAQSTVNMTMEEFYAQARDADVLIYNSAIDSPLSSVKELEDISPLFASFKAVAAGEVWCTEKDMYQEITAVTATVEDLKAIFSGEASGRDELQYMHRLR